MSEIKKTEDVSTLSSEDLQTEIYKAAHSIAKIWRKYDKIDHNTNALLSRAYKLLHEAAKWCRQD